MRRIEYLLTQVRASTENDGPNAQAIGDAEFMQHFNDAQDRLQSVLVGEYSKHFTKEGFIALVAGQDEYDLPTDMLLNTLVSSVERTTNSNPGTDDYFPLDRIDLVERHVGTGYLIRNKKIIVSPVPTGNYTNGLRINYIYKIPTLDIRRGEVSAINDGTSLTITGHTATEALLADYVSAVDFDGIQQIVAIKNKGFTNGTGVMLTDTSLTGLSLGDFVILGKNSSSHSMLEDICERYLVEYVSLRIFHRDSSSDKIFQSDVMQAIETDIMNLYATMSMDIDLPPVTNLEYL